MTSQITKDFQMKSKLRKYADGGSVRPALLGDGMAGRAGGLLSGRGRQIDDAVDGAANPKPTQTSAPAEAPKPEKKGLRSFFGLADGGVSAEGGRVKGPGGRTEDKVGPVMLSDEEYVLPGDTADAIGRDKLDAIRLATHDFKSDSKESALRAKVKGEEPVGLADGGAWIADGKGNVRKPNAFGDAAAGPNYTQPKLPPPQAGTAVATQAPPMGQRPPIDITPPGSRTAPPAQVVDAVTDVRAKTPMTRAMGVAKSALRGGAPIAGIAGAIEAGALGGGDLASGYRDQFQKDMGVQTPLGSVAADAARTLASVGDAALFGLPGRLGRGIANTVGGGSFIDGFTSDSARDQFEAARARDPLAGGGKKPPSPVTAAASALRSDQGAELPVQPGSYQSRRLSQMGVPEDVQNSAPIVDSALRGTQGILKTGGTDKFQNLGTYGGNANIYGRSSDPSRPGRINEFVGVGAGASPENEYSGSGSGGGGGAIRSTAASALRGLGNSSPAQGGDSPTSASPTQGVGAPTNDVAKQIAEINARYNRVLEGGRGKSVEFGSDWSQRHGIALEKARGDELSSVLNNANTNETSRANAQLNAETSRANAELNARVQMADVQSRAETTRGTLASQVQAAQRKAIEDARKIGEERDAESVKAYESVADSFAGGDKEKGQRFREILSALGPELDQLAQGLTPTDKRAFYTNILRQQIGRDEGLVLGRDVGATAQNAAIGGLIGRMSRFGDGAAGKAVDTALGKLPRVGPAISALRPMENLTRFGTILGAGAGAMATPEIEEYNRFDPIARDSVSGAALPARQDLREAFTYGGFDTYFNPFNDDVQTVSGRRTDRPNPTEEEAARRYRATLRTE